MRTFIPFSLIFILLSCGGSGLEGFVNEPITITALDPDEGQDFDYFWSVENQPDGSLINSRDLKHPMEVKKWSLLQIIQETTQLNL